MAEFVNPDILNEEPMDVSGNTPWIAIAEGFNISLDIYEKLYEHQKVAVKWMYGLYRRKKGGVLADDMGLGKTFEVIAFLSGLFLNKREKHILIALPVTLMKNWKDEFEKWCPSINVRLFQGNIRKREINANEVKRDGGVLLTSYGVLLSKVYNLDDNTEDGFTWDYFILDEAQKIKNPSQTSSAVKKIPAKHRLAVTGTPIQNNLMELWSLFNFVQPDLLGSKEDFRRYYVKEIQESLYKDDSDEVKRLSHEKIISLKEKIKDYFLSRTKDEIRQVDIENEIEPVKKTFFPQKKELVVWCLLSEKQCGFYKKFCECTKPAHEVHKSYYISKHQALKKICDHPQLLNQNELSMLGYNELQENSSNEMSGDSSRASSIEISDEILLEESAKMKFLISLLENLKENGHKTLVFSLSLDILNMIERILHKREFNVLRMDGKTPKNDREENIEKFQTDPEQHVFLLTTQVGGIGITITAADRVIIYTPSYNPKVDAQAVDRAFRIGQMKDVIVYRLITCDTVEEKIYRNQIFKDSLAKTITDENNPYSFSYFSMEELQQQCSIKDLKGSATQEYLDEVHSNDQESDPDLEEHIDFLHSLNIFGVNHHDRLFT